MGNDKSKLYETEWNLVVNLGIKCNTLGISRSANVRYYSSPFDNMDTVEGLRDCADLMADGFENYYLSEYEQTVKEEISNRVVKLNENINRILNED